MLCEGVVKKDEKNASKELALGKKMSRFAARHDGDREKAASGNSFKASETEGHNQRVGTGFRRLFQQLFALRRESWRR